MVWGDVLVEKKLRFGSILIFFIRGGLMNFNRVCGKYININYLFILNLFVLWGKLSYII